MLIIGLLNIIIQSSLIHKPYMEDLDINKSYKSKNIKINYIYRLTINILIFSIYLLHKSNKIYYINNGIEIWNGLLIINNSLIYIIYTILLISIIYLLIIILNIIPNIYNSDKINNMYYIPEYIDSYYKRNNLNIIYNGISILRYIYNNIKQILINNIVILIKNNENTYRLLHWINLRLIRYRHDLLNNVISIKHILVYNLIELFLTIKSKIIKYILINNVLINNNENNINYLIKDKDIKDNEINEDNNKINNTIYMTLENKVPEITIIILYNVISGIILSQASNLLLIYLMIELQSFSIYVLIGIYKKSYKTLRTSLTYFLIGTLGSIIILLGIIILYENTNLLNITDINHLLNNVNITWNYNNNIYYIDNIMYGYMIMILGLLLKIGIVPFHNWLINIYHRTDTIITLWISLIVKLNLFNVIFKIPTNLSSIILPIFNINNNNIYNNINISTYQSTIANINYDSNNNLSYDYSYISIDIPSINNVIIILSILTLIIGSIGGLSQIKLKRIIIYSGLVNSGYILLSLISPHYTYDNIKILAYNYNIIQYSISHIILLYILLLLMNNKNNIYIKDLIGLFNINKLLSIGLIIVLFSLIGIPPLVGFYGKYYILKSLLNKGYWFISLILILVSLITTVFYIFIINNLFKSKYNHINIKSLNNNNNNNNDNYYIDDKIQLSIGNNILLSILIVLILVIPNINILQSGLLIINTILN